VPLPEPVVPEPLEALCVTFDRVPLSSPEEEELSSSLEEDDELSSAALTSGLDI
jgi:hypothetical protein